MPSDKIPINGEPICVRLDSLNAKEVPSKFNGKDYVYMCNGGENHIYLPDDAVEAVRNSRARAGDQVTIQRKKEGVYVRWIVRVVSDAAEPPPAAVAPPSRRATNGAQNIAPPLPDAAYYEPPADAPEQATGFLALSKCYRDAIDVAIDALRHAKAQGLPLPSPVFEDIRCMAATLLIEGRR